MTMFAFQNLILRTGRLIKKFPCTLFVLVGKKNDAVCVVADDTKIYLSMINISHYIRSHFYF